MLNIKRSGFSLILFLLVEFTALAQRGGIPSYPVLSREQAIKKGYKLVDNTDALLQEIKIDGNKIFISGSFDLKERAEISGNNIVIESDKKSVITSNLWFNKYRFYESFTINGKNVTLRGLILKGSDCDIKTLDYKYAQTAIRCHADSFHIENCAITCFGWAALYMHRYQGAVIEQCYLARNKNSGYGYGVWFEGKPGSVGMVKNCVFEDNREAVDAGGQLGAWSLIGSVIDNSVQSHKNPEQKAGIGETIEGNYFIEKKAGMGFPVPATDTGWVIIRNNYFEGDSTRASVSDIATKAQITIRDNHYNSVGMNRPACKLEMESVKGNDYRFKYSSPSSSYYEMIWGDGSDPVMNESEHKHDYPVPGTYTPRLRVFNSDGIPSIPVTSKIVNGSGLNAAIKTTARFTPAAGSYAVQLLIDDSVVLKFDAADVWMWKRINFNPTQKGRHKIAIRLVCMQDCTNVIQLWIDDFDYNGTLANSGFEDDRIYHHPPKSNWNQKFLCNIPVGSGITNQERCGGQFSWHFEFRPRKNIVKGDSYAELFQFVYF
ncbi:MAG: PKD domain-containing protein [Bacteroidota bacterium]